MTTTKPKWREVMLNEDSLYNILTNPQEEKTLFLMIKQMDLTAIRMYKLTAILEHKENWPKLASLIEKLRAAGIIYIAAQRSSYFRHVEDEETGTIAFNTSCASDLQRFNVLGIEGEPWQTDRTKEGYVAYKLWMDDIKKTNKYCQQNGLTNDVYVHKFLDTTTNTATSVIAHDLAYYNKRVNLTCYINTTKLITKGRAWTEMLNRLILLGTQAAQMVKMQEVLVLFNCKDTEDGIWDYLTYHSLLEALMIITRDFEANTFNGKGNLKLIGFGGFGFNQLKRLVNLSTTSLPA